MTDDQAGTLRKLKLKRRGGDQWRAHALKEALRAEFAGDLSEGEVGVILDRFCSKAQRSGASSPSSPRPRPARGARGILAAVRHGINARHESLNRRVRLIINRLRHPLRQRGTRPHHAPIRAIEHVLPHETSPGLRSLNRLIFMPGGPLFSHLGRHVPRTREPSVSYPGGGSRFGTRRYLTIRPAWR